MIAPSNDKVANLAHGFMDAFVEREADSNSATQTAESDRRKELFQSLKEQRKNAAKGWPVERAAYKAGKNIQFRSPSSDWIDFDSDSKEPPSFDSPLWLWRVKP